MPANQIQGDLDLARGYIRAGAFMTGGATLSVAGLGAALLVLEPELFAPAYRAPIAVALCVMPLFALQDYLEGVARSQNWIGLAIAPPYLLRQTLMMACMIAAVLLGAPPRAEVAMGCMLVAAAVATALQATLLITRLRRELADGPNRYHWRTWLGTSLPIAAIDLANAGFTFVDVIVLGALVSPAEVGVYFAATRIQQFVVFVHFAVSAATLQRYSAAHAVENRFLLARTRPAPSPPDRGRDGRSRRRDPGRLSVAPGDVRCGAQRQHPDPVRARGRKRRRKSVRAGRGSSHHAGR